MHTGTSLQVAVTESPAPRFSLQRLLGGLGRVFPRNRQVEAVVTRVVVSASPAEVWRAIHFYEDLPAKPHWFLRFFLPQPIRTEGDKTVVGALVRCTYDGGHLMKRITVLEPPHLIAFEVLDQDLGIEGSISLGDGSYTLRAIPGGTELTLVTHYRGHLRPRWLWRPFERLLGRRLHRHILSGMRAVLAEGERALPAAETRAARASG